MPTDHGGKISALKPGLDSEVPLDQLEVPIQRILGGGRHSEQVEARSEEFYGWSASTLPGNYRAHVGAWVHAWTTGVVS